MRGTRGGEPYAAQRYVRAFSVYHAGESITLNAAPALRTDHRRAERTGLAGPDARGATQRHRATSRHRPATDKPHTSHVVPGYPTAHRARRAWGDGPFASSTPPATPGPGLSRASPPHTSPPDIAHCGHTRIHLPPRGPTGSILVSSGLVYSSATLRTGLTETFTWNGIHTTRQVSHITVRIGQRPRAERTEKPTIHRNRHQCHYTGTATAGHTE